MSTAQSIDPSPGRLWSRAVLVAAGLFAVYLLGFGPALSLAYRDLIPLRFVLRVYQPLPFGFRQWYLNLWGRLDSRCGRTEYLAPPLSSRTYER